MTERYLTLRNWPTKSAPGTLEEAREALTEWYKRDGKMNNNTIAEKVERQLKLHFCDEYEAPC